MYESSTKQFNQPFTESGSILVANNGQSRFSFDKIGIGVPLDLVNIERIKDFRKDDFGINIIDYPPTTVQLNVHAEWHHELPIHSHRVYLAMNSLIEEGVLNKKLSRYLSPHSDDWGYQIESGKNLIGFTTLLSKLDFVPRAWETSFDFVHVDPIEEKGWSKDDFHLVFPKDGQKIKPDAIPGQPSLYSNDNYQSERTDKFGVTESAGSQDSFFIRYLKLLRGISGVCYRMEMRNVGLYKEDLWLGLLDGTTWETYQKMLPQIAMRMIALTKPDNLKFNPAWIQFAPPWLSELLTYAHWTDGLANMVHDEYISKRRNITVIRKYFTRPALLTA